jgi:hypothetical protein
VDGGPVLKVDGGFVVCVDGCTLTVGKVDKLGDGVVCSTHIIVGSALGCALRRLGSALGCALMVGTTLTLGGADGCTLTVGKVDKLGDGVVCDEPRGLGSALGCALMVGTTLTLGMVVGGAELAILGAKLTLG